MSKSLGLTLLVSLVCCASMTVSATTLPCPQVGFADGCTVLITLSNNAGGTAPVAVVTITGAGLSGTYDGADDTLVGVINNSSFVITGLGLTGNGIGGFDGDGAWSGGTSCVSAGGAPFGCPAASGTGDPQHYAGPLTTFPAFSSNAVTVVFGAALGTGGTSYFSLEQAPSVGQIGVQTINPPGVPEPSSLMLMASGLAGMAGVIRKKLRK